jgi:hypothetical protein
MEALSRAYVSAIAAAAGYVVSTSDFDRDSVDLVLSAGGAMRPQLAIQLKATTKIPTRAAQFKFSLSKKNYDDLRTNTRTPRILVVLAMPKSSTSWLSHKVQRLILRRCAFWKSLRGLPESENETKIQITLDTSQVFDVPTLVDLMEKSRTATAL